MSPGIDCNSLHHSGPHAPVNRDSPDDSRTGARIKADGTTAAVLVRVRRVGGHFCASAMRPRLQHWGIDRDWFDRTACLARSSTLVEIWLLCRYTEH